MYLVNRRKLGIWSHLLKKSLMENSTFLCSVLVIGDSQRRIQNSVKLLG